MNYPPNVSPSHINALVLPQHIEDHPPTNEVACGCCGELLSVKEALALGWYTDLEDWSQDRDGIIAIYGTLPDEERMCSVCALFYLALIV